MSGCGARTAATRSNFITCMGFIRTISEGSRDADSRSAGEARLRFITLAAPLGAMWPVGHAPKVNTDCSSGDACNDHMRNGDRD
jgi:hypothetical protein